MPFLKSSVWVAVGMAEDQDIAGAENRRVPGKSARAVVEPHLAIRAEGGEATAARHPVELTGTRADLAREIAGGETEHAAFESQPAFPGSHGVVDAAGQSAGIVEPQQAVVERGDAGVAVRRGEDDGSGTRLRQGSRTADAAGEAQGAGGGLGEHESIHQRDRCRDDVVAAARLVQARGNPGVVEDHRSAAGGEGEGVGAVGIAQIEGAERGGAGELDGLVSADVIVDPHADAGGVWHGAGRPVARGVPLLGAGGGGGPGEAAGNHAADRAGVLAEAGVVRVAGREGIAIADAVHGNVKHSGGHRAAQRDRPGAAAACSAHVSRSGGLQQHAAGVVEFDLQPQVRTQRCGLDIDHQRTADRVDAEKIEVRVAPDHAADSGGAGIGA